MEKKSKVEALCLNCNKWVRNRIEWYDETSTSLGFEIRYRARRAIFHGTNPGEPQTRRETAAGRSPGLQDKETRFFDERGFITWEITGRKRPTSRNKGGI